jgi:hypothetical protein
LATGPPGEYDDEQELQDNDIQDGIQADDEDNDQIETERAHIPLDRNRENFQNV